MKPSKKFSLNVADLKAQLKSALIFLGPTLLSILVVVSPALDTIKLDNTQKMILIPIIKWVLDQLTGLLRRYLAGK